MKATIVKHLIILVFVCKSCVTKEIKRSTDTNETAVSESAIKVANKKLHVAIYYESLCPDSIRFITNQLDPTYGYFKDYIDIELIPFGKSESFIHENRTEFSCQHGPAECTGNKVQSCTLRELCDRSDDQIKYVACQMDPSNGVSEWTGKACSDSVNVTWSNVEACSKGPIGTQLQLDAEQLTHQIAKPYPAFIPTIVYNRVWDSYKQRRTLYDFQDVLCHEISPLDGQDLPSVCYSKEAEA